MVEGDIPQWDSRAAYLMAMIGSAIGVGNIWRFPNVIYSNGGSSFLIPYICAFLILGICMMLFENTLGYKFRRSIPCLFMKIKEKYEFVGWFFLISVFLVMSYYACIIAWDLIYVVLSFTKSWGSEPDLFFNTVLLNSTPSLSGIFTFIPVVLVSIIVVWIMVLLICRTSINKGIGKVCRILIPVLIIMTIIIVAFSFTLPGASIGYMQLLSPDWYSLTNLSVWLAAFGQILFSLGLGEGIIIAYAVYLPKDINLVRNTGIVASINSLFEVFNSFGIFSILGFMTLTSGIPFNQLISNGTGLAFVVFPQVFNLMGPAAYIVGPLFFLSLFFAGITSAVALLEPITYAISNKFDFNRKKATYLVCGICFAVSLLFATSSGSYLLSIVDNFSGNICLLTGVFLECVLFTWFYKFDDIVKVNINNFPKHFDKVWKAIVKYILPVFLIVLWINGVWGILNETLPIKGVTFVLILVVIFVPLILSKFTAKNKEYYNSD